MTDQKQTPDATPYIPYDAGYPRVQKPLLTLQEYVLQRERPEQPESYVLGLGAFAQFLLEAFPALYPTYQIPDPKDGGGEHLLELFLRAHYGKYFSVGTYTFQVEDDIGLKRGMPQWAIRWMVLWAQLPPGAHIGRDEVLALLDWLWNVVMDARSVLDAAVDNWLYGKIYGERK